MNRLLIKEKFREKILQEIDRDFVPAFEDEEVVNAFIECRWSFELLCRTRKDMSIIHDKLHRSTPNASSSTTLGFIEIADNTETDGGT